MSSTTILHVEDDPHLAEIVEVAFTNFGFKGAVLHAGTVAGALDTIRSRTEENQPLDMIIVDLNLPDGKGLDVVHAVKTNPAWASMPVLLLTNETDSYTVAEAYALGANCYLPKNCNDLFELLESVYDCWFDAGLLPKPKNRNPLEELMGRTVSYKTQAYEFYARLARVFKQDPDRSSFWLSLALFQSNQANFVAFVMRSRRKTAVKTPFIDLLNGYALAKSTGLQTALKLFRENPNPTMEQALGWALEVERAFDPGILGATLTMSFPNEPAATSAYMESMSAYLQQLSKRALQVSKDEKIREAAESLVARATVLRQEFRPVLP